MCADVRPGHMVNRPAYIVLHQVERTGEKIKAW
jgi:hypothetical protein